MKFELRLNNVPVQIKPGGSYEMELNNPAVEFDAVMGSRGMNIELADSVVNHEVLGWINDPRSASSEMLLNAEQYASGNLIDVGYCYVRDAKRGGLLDFTSNLSQFFGIYQAMKLSDIDLGTIGTPVWNSTLSNTWSSGGFVLPTVVNSLFFKDYPAPVGWDGKMNSYSSGYLTDTPKVPFFFLKYVMKKVGDLAGVKFVGAVWDWAEFGKLMVFNCKTGFNNAPMRLMMPDLTIAELLLALRKWLNVYMAFDVTTKTIRLDWADAKLKANPEKDWSDKLPKLRGGLPVKTDGLQLEFVADSGDALGKDEWLASWTTADDNASTLKKVSTAMVPMVLKGGALAAEVAGVDEDENSANRAVVRIARWNGAAGNADVSIVPPGGGAAVAMNWAGIYDKFWTKTDQTAKDSYVIEVDAALDANDVAWVAECYRGEIADAPVVHAQGVTWEVLKVTVPYGKSRIARVKMRRI
jgi:hypothetical protein